MYGENRKYVAQLCKVCNAQCPVWIDPDDLQRALLGLEVQHAFASRDDKPYLTAAGLQLFISGTCGNCWDKLHPRCMRCGKGLIGPHRLCSECLEVAELCQLVGEFVTQAVGPVQAVLKGASVNVSAAALLATDFFDVVMTFGFADGSLAGCEMKILAALFCYLTPESVKGADAIQVASRYA